MKKSLLLPLLFALSMPVAAQWVTIPDANFANKLNELFPECMDGDQMNTECNEIIYETYLDVQWSGIYDLTGIEYFVNLEHLSCPNNNLTWLPNLPSSLISLGCHFNNLTSLPTLPGTLSNISCYNNNLTSLSALPQSLIYLHCQHNNLTLLPPLPGLLMELHCYTNNLTQLPSLPESLVDFNCATNNLTQLPDLPQNLSTLVCTNNQISCLPTLPDSLTILGISGNPFTCLPNYIPAMSGVWLSYPLCGLGDDNNNPFGCNTTNGIAGTIYHDLNSDCLKNEMEGGLINASIKLLNEFDEVVGSALTFSNGETFFYNIMANIGNYTVQLDTVNMPFQVSCVDPGDAQEVELTADEPSVLNVDFGVECLPGFDVGVQSVVTTGWVFPGQFHIMKVAAGDMSNWFGLECTEGVSGTVTIFVDGPVSYVEAGEDALTPTVSGELQFTYDIADFGAVNFQQDFALLLETVTTAQTDDLVCVDVIVNPIDDDTNPANNTYNHCYSVVNSYDPNIKQVWPQNVEPGYDDYFNYTIYFQNTGTAPAFNIRVADTLDTNLDLNTFEVTAYSHACLTYVSGNVATFRFNNIMLPDSTSDFEGSIGYVQYRIKPIADLPVGTVIENTAHIYFDFNEAIVTNTTQNVFEIITSVTEQPRQQVQVFPNPTSGMFTIVLDSQSNKLSSIEVFNINGQRILQTQTNQNREMLDLGGSPSGIYIVRVSNNQSVSQTKLTKH